MMPEMHPLLEMLLRGGEGPETKCLQVMCGGIKTVLVGLTRQTTVHGRRLTGGVGGAVVRPTLPTGGKLHIIRSDVEDTVTATAQWNSQKPHVKVFYNGDEVFNKQDVDVFFFPISARETVLHHSQLMFQGAPPECGEPFEISLVEFRDPLPGEDAEVRAKVARDAAVQAREKPKRNKAKAKAKSGTAPCADSAGAGTVTSSSAGPAPPEPEGPAVKTLHCMFLDMSLWGRLDTLCPGQLPETV